MVLNLSKVKEKTARDAHLEVLMVATDPSTQHRIQLQAEERAIRKSLESCKPGVNVALDVLPAATIDDVADRLLWKWSNGSSYDIVHFSGHCDQQHHMVRLIYEELERQHGPEVTKRFKTSKASVRGIHELAGQVSRHLETQSAFHMDEVDPADEDHGQDEDHDATSSPEEGDIEASGEDDVRKENDSQGANTQGDERRGEAYLAKPRPRPRSLSCDGVERRGRDAVQDPSSPRSEDGKKSHSMTPDLRLVKVKRGAQDLMETEERVADGGIWVFQQGAVPPSPPPAHDEPAGCSDQDSLVLRIPDVDRCTKDIVLTKSQILKAGVGSLAFETGTGSGMNFVTATSFAAVLSPYALDMSCVIFNACHSQLVCEQTLAAGIPMAVCAQGRMSDASALHFSRGFYEALSRGASIERAFLEGRTRIEAHERLQLRPVQPSTTSLTRMGAAQHRRKVEEGRFLLLRSNGRMQLHPVSVHRHHSLREENASFKQIIDQGLKLLKEKDQEIDKLKRELAALREENERQGAQGARRRDNRVRIKKKPSATRPTKARTKSYEKPWLQTGSGTKRETSNERQGRPRTKVFTPAGDRPERRRTSTAKKQHVFAVPGTAGQDQQAAQQPQQQQQPGSPTHQQQQPQQARRENAGFGSCTPRFPAVSVFDPLRYEKES